MSRRWRGGGELIKILRPASQLCLEMTSSFKFKQISKQNPVIWLRRKGVSRREERRIEIDGTGRKCNIKSWRGVCWYPARRSLPRYTRRHPDQNLTPTSTEMEEIRDRAGDIVLVCLSQGYCRRADSMQQWPRYRWKAMKNQLSGWKREDIKPVIGLDTYVFENNKIINGIWRPLYTFHLPRFFRVWKSWLLIKPWETTVSYNSSWLIG